MTEEVSNLILMELLKPNWSRAMSLFVYAIAMIIIASAVVTFFPHSSPFRAANIIIYQHLHMDLLLYRPLVMLANEDQRSTIKTTPINNEEKTQEKERERMLSQNQCFCQIIATGIAIAK